MLYEHMLLPDFALNVGIGYKFFTAESSIMNVNLRRLLDLRVIKGAKVKTLFVVLENL